MSDSGSGPTLPPEAAAGIDELAEDMVELLRRLKDLERAGAELGARLERIEEQVVAGGQEIGRTVDALRRDLIEERRAMTSRHAFDAVCPVLDSLRATRDSLPDGVDEVVRDQLAAVISTLSTLLQGLGFARFDVEEGAAFDPARMECVGYAEGTPGVVVRAVRPGFAVGEAVVRPAGVLIAEPGSPGAAG